MDNAGPICDHGYGNCNCNSGGSRHRGRLRSEYGASYREYSGGAAKEVVEDYKEALKLREKNRDRQKGHTPLPRETTDKDETSDAESFLSDNRTRIAGLEPCCEGKHHDHQQQGGGERSARYREQRAYGKESSRSRRRYRHRHRTRAGITCSDYRGVDLYDSDCEAACDHRPPFAQYGYGSYDKRTYNVLSPTEVQRSALKAKARQDARRGHAHVKCHPKPSRDGPYSEYVEPHSRNKPEKSSSKDNYCPGSKEPCPTFVPHICHAGGGRHICNPQAGAIGSGSRAGLADKYNSSKYASGYANMPSSNVPPGCMQEFNTGWTRCKHDVRNPCDRVPRYWVPVF